MALALLGVRLSDGTLTLKAAAFDTRNPPILIGSGDCTVIDLAPGVWAGTLAVRLVALTNVVGRTIPFICITDAAT